MSLTAMPALRPMPSGRLAPESEGGDGTTLAYLVA